jgi:type IV pilus assembly protein PilW
MSRVPTTSMPRQIGLSLIELLVAMAIGLVVTLAASTVLLNFEGDKRRMTTLNDVNQAGAFASYVLNRAIRNAGSGFALKGDVGYGCQLNASRSGSAILPAPAELPAPFDGFDATLRTFRLAPIVIYDGASSTGSDVLAVMSGSHGFSEIPSRVLDGSITADGVRLRSTWGWRANDLALVMQSGVGCLVQQVNNAAGAAFVGSEQQQLPFSGDYYATGMTGFGGGGGAAEVYVAPIGNATDSPPLFQLIGVGANNTLVTHDLLRTNGVGEAPQAVMEGVEELHAVYGVDIDSDGDVDRWQSPSSAPWDAASLLDGTAASAGLLRQIVAVRVGLVLRTNLEEKTVDGPVSPESVQLFTGTDLPGLRLTRTLTAAQRQFRYKTVEFSVPLRNVLSTNLND